MRSHWETLHLQFVSSIRSRSSTRAFDSLKAAHPAILGGFADAPAVIARLNDHDDAPASLDEKDRILALFVRSASAPGLADLATAALLLGLWPGLSRMFDRLSRLYPREGDDLASDVVARFAVCARRLDPSRCQRIAATLILNTERVVKSARMLDLKYQARRTSFEGHHADTLADPDSQRTTDLIELRVWLSVALPNEADFVFSIVTGRTTCRKAADALGISYATARQRLARALREIRRKIASPAVTG